MDCEGILALHTGDGLYLTSSGQKCFSPEDALYDPALPQVVKIYAGAITYHRERCAHYVYTLVRTLCVRTIT